MRVGEGKQEKGSGRDGRKWRGFLRVGSHLRSNS